MTWPTSWVLHSLAISSTESGTRGAKQLEAKLKSELKFGVGVELGEKRQRNVRSGIIEGGNQ
jgi:hypothetical protein